MQPTVNYEDHVLFIFNLSLLNDWLLPTNIGCKTMDGIQMEGMKMHTIW